MNEEKKDKPVTWEQVGDIVGGAILIFLVATYIMLMIFWLNNRNFLKNLHYFIREMEQVQLGDLTPSTYQAPALNMNADNKEVKVFFENRQFYTLTSSSTINVSRQD